MDGETKTQSGLWGTSLGIPWLRLQASNAEGVDLIPGQRTKLPHFKVWPKKKKERERVDCGEFLPDEGSDTEATTRGMSPTHHTSEWKLMGKTRSNTLLGWFCLVRDILSCIITTHILSYFSFDCIPLIPLGICSKFCNH